MDQFPKIYLYRRIVQAKCFMDEHYADPINLDDIADEAFFSKFHFLRIFKITYGKTPHKYLTSVRIEKAKLLMQKKIPVTEACFLVGFESISSFTGLFRKHTGSSPSAYQKEQLLRKEEIRKTPLKFIPNCFADHNGWNKNSNFQEAN